MNDPWPFDQPRNCASFALRQIFDGSKPILYVIHDIEDHGWQFLTLEDVKMEDALLVGLEEVVKLDPSVLEIADMPPGWSAKRKSKSDPWVRERET